MKSKKLNIIFIIIIILIVLIILLLIYNNYYLLQNSKYNVLEKFSKKTTKTTPSTYCTQDYRDSRPEVMKENCGYPREFICDKNKNSRTQGKYKSIDRACPLNYNYNEMTEYCDPDLDDKKLIDKNDLIDSNDKRTFSPQYPCKLNFEDEKNGQIFECVTDENDKNVGKYKAVYDETNNQYRICPMCNNSNGDYNPTKSYIIPGFNNLSDNDRAKPQYCEPYNVQTE